MGMRGLQMLKSNLKSLEIKKFNITPSLREPPNKFKMPNLKPEVLFKIKKSLNMVINNGLPKGPIFWLE